MPATLLIDEDFKNLIPPLTDEEFAQLESNILRDGIREPLVIWNGTLLDGHNRFKIAQKHALDFRTTELSFADRNDAIIWIIKNQFGRRNLSAYDRSVLALKLKPAIAAKAKARQVEAGGAIPQKSAKPPIETRQELATVAGVSHDTIAKVEKINAEAPPEIIAALRAGSLSIHAAYMAVKSSSAIDEATAQIQQSLLELRKNTDELLRLLAAAESRKSPAEFRAWCIENFGSDADSIRAGVQNYLGD